MSEAKMTGRKVNKPGCATVRNQVTALFSLPIRLGQHVDTMNMSFSRTFERAVWHFDLNFDIKKVP